MGQTFGFGFQDTSAAVQQSILAAAGAQCLRLGGAAAAEATARPWPHLAASAASASYSNSGSLYIPLRPKSETETVSDFGLRPKSETKVLNQVSDRTSDITGKRRHI